jgi:hypothetical protein
MDNVQKRNICMNDPNLYLSRFLSLKTELQFKRKNG